MLRSPTIRSHTVAAPCALARVQIPVWVDGELDEERDPTQVTRHALLVHLADCPSCARLERALRNQRIALHRLADRARAQDVASDALRARVAALFTR